MSQNEMLTLLKLVSYRRQTPAIGSLLLYLSSISLSLFCWGRGICRLEISTRSYTWLKPAKVMSHLGKVKSEQNILGCIFNTKIGGGKFEALTETLQTYMYKLKHSN